MSRSTRAILGPAMSGKFLASEEELTAGAFEVSSFLGTDEAAEAETFIENFSMDECYVVEFKVVAKYVKKGVVRESI